MSESASWRVWQDRKVTAEFTRRRRNGVLGSDAQVDTLLRLLSQVGAGQLDVLDLGCGDGFLLQAVMEAFPVSRGVALDGSPSMLEKAEVRFQDLGLLSGLVEFVEADFSEPDWLDHLPHRSFDAIISGLAIHHIEDDRKQQLYAEIFGLLKPGGLFVNIEHVSSRTPLGELLFEQAYAQNIARVRRQQGEEVTDEQVYAEFSWRPDKAANRLALVETQLEWLRAIGFRHVDCYWRWFELAVMAGYKPAD